MGLRMERSSKSLLSFDLRSLYGKGALQWLPVIHGILVKHEWI